MTVLASRVSAAPSWARAAATAADAASRAVRASSSPCWVISPTCLRLPARSSSRAARVSRTSVWRSAARAAARPASASRGSIVARGWPFRTATHSVTWTAATIPEYSDLISAASLGASEPTTSTDSVTSPLCARATSTATGGRPASPVLGRAHAVAPATATAPMTTTTRLLMTPAPRCGPTPVAEPKERRGSKSWSARWAMKNALVRAPPFG
jgi:hypothetical protein